MLAINSYTDANAINLIERPFSDTIYNMVLSATVEDHITIPAGAGKVLINSDANIYVKIGSASVAATVPSSDITDGTGSVLNPAGFSLKSTDVRISCISAQAAKISLEFYS